MKPFIYTLFLFLLSAIVGAGCKKFLDTSLPVDQLTGEAIFANDAAATAAVNGVYTQLVNGTGLQGNKGLSVRTGLYTDELTAVTNFSFITMFYFNSPDNTSGGEQWAQFYIILYSVNHAINGIQASQGLSANRKQQLLGELFLTRALCFFYLTNLYGKVALAVGDNMDINNRLTRAAQPEVYKQIIADALKAKELLAVEYRNGNGEVTQDRGRPNKASASTLLARTYLYTEDWNNAAAEATSVISQTGVYQLLQPASVFLLNSKELIWGLIPSTGTNNIKEAQLYGLSPGLPPTQTATAILSASLVNAFEPGDARFTNWVASSTAAGITSYAPFKYKARTASSVLTEYLVLFRLAELYLIRAEAQARLGILTGLNSAIADIDVIRSRAGLTATTAVAETAVLSAIRQERRVELFTEMGHHLFDLRRTGKLDEVMNNIAPTKGATWQAWKRYWPIAGSEIVSNPNLEQTDGYAP